MAVIFSPAAKKGTWHRRAMEHDRVDSHWKQPDADDAEGWRKEMRQRSHDLANWATRMEGLMVEASGKLADMSTADEIASIVEARIKRNFISIIGYTPKLLGALVLAMQLIILIRG